MNARAHHDNIQATCTTHATKCEFVYSNARLWGGFAWETY